MLGHLLNNLVGHGGNVSAGQCAVGDMDGITDRSRNNFGMNIRVVAEDLADGLDEIDTGLADVIKTSEEGADVSSTGTRSQQCLIGREDEGAVGGDALSAQSLDSLESLHRHRDFDDHVLGVKGIDSLALFNHRLCVGGSGLYLTGNRAIDDGCDLGQSLGIVLVLLCDKAGVSGNTSNHAHVVCLADLVHICSVNFVRLELGIGSEQNGVRPVVILQNDVGNACSPTLIVAALTSKIEKKAMQPTHSLVELDSLEPSIVQTEQIFTIDKSRVIKYLGHLTSEEMHRVDDAVRISLALNPMGSVQKLKPIIRSTAAYAPPETVDGQPPVYPYTPIKSNFEDAGTVQEMMMYTELQSAVQAMIQRLEYSFTFNPSLLTIPKRKKQVTEILEEAEKYIWRIKEEMRCA